MSFVQTYRLAVVAREKLLSEAHKPDHNLHHLVLHAKLLDDVVEAISLMELEMAKEVQQVVAKSYPEIQSSSGSKVKKSILPEVVLHHIRLHGPSQPVVFMEGIDEEVAKEDKNSLPCLSHDDSESESESESDLDSDSESSDSEEEDTKLEWLATSVSEGKLQVANDKGEELILHSIASQTWKPSLQPS